MKYQKALKDSINLENNTLSKYINKSSNNLSNYQN